MGQWEVQRTTGACTVTGRTLEEGEEYYAALFEEGDSFRRVDYCLEAWNGPPEGSFCHFRTRVPTKRKARKLLVDDAALVGFFRRLEDETEEARVQFRFVLALILMRKRQLKYVRSQTENGIETWDMTLTVDQSEHSVVNPRLTDDQIELVSRQLTAILHGDAVSALADVASSAPADNDATDDAGGSAITAAEGGRSDAGQEGQRDDE